MWENTALNNIARVVYGKGLSEAERSKNGSVPVYGSSGEVGRHKDSFVDHPTIILARKGSVGNVFRVEEPSWPIDTVYFLKDIQIDIDYLFYYLQSQKFRNTSTTIPSLRREDLEAIQIKYPKDKSLQVRIVESIETQFTRLDAAIKSLKAIKAKIKLFRISVLKATFDREWHYDKLGHLFKTTSGGTPSRSNKKYYTGTIPWLKSGELNDDKHIEDSEEHITQEAIDNSSAKKFPPNTVMIALYGATTGKLGILKKESTTNQAICGIFPQEGYITEFVFYFLLFKRAALISQGKGGAQPNISQGIVKDTDFPKADEKTQREVIDFVESQLSIIDKISDVVDASLVKAEKLRKSILKSAFEGRLVW